MKTNRLLETCADFRFADLPAKIAQSVARLTLVGKVVSSSPTAGRLTQPSIPLWVGKMSTWQMMAIGRICAFQIGSLCQLGNQDMAALVLYAPKGVDLRGGGSSS